MSEVVEIVFGEASLSEEEIKEIIGRHTNATDYDIEIVSREGDDTTTTVIVRFKEAETAKDFVRSVTSKGSRDSHFVRNISFLSEASDLEPSSLGPLFTVVVAGILLLAFLSSA